MLRVMTLGQNFPAEQHLQYAVPAGYRFGATSGTGSAFLLVGCTVSSDFDFTDLGLDRREALLTTLSNAAACIRDFCPAENGI